MAGPVETCVANTLPESAVALLQLFRRQYLQLLDRKYLSLPEDQHLRDTSVQRWLYEHCFDEECNPYLPPPRYRTRVLKLITARIEIAIVDPEEDTMSDDLMEALASLMASGLPSEVISAQTKNWVTHSFPRPPTPRKIVDIKRAASESSIVLRENREIISGAGTTGLRTWEAALHLGAFLLDSPETSAQISGKNVLELGAGSGFLSIFCATQLHARHVLATDGDGQIVEELRTNLFYNGVETEITAATMRWGTSLKDSIVEAVAEDIDIDLIIGADLTYDKIAIPALISTLLALFARWPKADVLIAATIRNVDTFDHFALLCGKIYLTRSKSHD